MNRSAVDTDLTFFTNEEDSTLLDRFVNTLPDAPASNPLSVLDVLRDHIPDGLLEKSPPGSTEDEGPREIILLAYRVSETNALGEDS